MTDIKNLLEIQNVSDMFFSKRNGRPYDSTFLDGSQSWARPPVAVLRSTSIYWLVLESV